MSGAAAYRPRVLFAIGGLGTGGSERQLVELLTRAHGQSLDAFLVTFEASGGRYAARVREAGIPHYPFPGRIGNRGVRALTGAPHVARILRRVGPDVIYAWLEQTALYFAPFARLWGIPLMVSRRNVCGARLERFAPAGAAIRAAERSARIVTTNSAAGALEAQRRGIRPERIRTIPNGHVAADPLPIPAELPVRLGCVAQLRREKGHARLLDVLSRVSARAPWQVDLAGDGPLRDELVNRAAALGLNGRVRFLGEVADIRSFWAEEHVALLFSSTEGSPNSLIEAAIAGRPMVATKTGGTPDVVPDGTGFLVEVDDHDAAARAVERLIDDPLLRTRFGGAAHRTAVERFSMDGFVEGHLRAIAEVRR